MFDTIAATATRIFTLYTTYGGASVADDLDILL